MKSQYSITPARVVLITLILVALHINFQDREKYLTELIGTLVLFPGILASLLPAPFNHMMVSAMAHNAAFINTFSLLPIVAVVAAIGCAGISIWKNSLALSYASAGALLMVFSTFHFTRHYCFTSI